MTQCQGMMSLASAKHPWAWKGTRHGALLPVATFAQHTEWLLLLGWADAFSGDSDFSLHSFLKSHLRQGPEARLLAPCSQEPGRQRLQAGRSSRREEQEGI